MHTDECSSTNLSSGALAWTVFVTNSHPVSQFNREIEQYHRVTRHICFEDGAMHSHWKGISRVFRINVLTDGTHMVGLWLPGGMYCSGV